MNSGDIFLRKSVDYFFTSAQDKDKRKRDLTESTQELCLTQWDGSLNANALRSLALALGPSLKHVSLASCEHLTDETFQSFCSRMEVLVSLDLSYCPSIGDASCRQVARFCSDTLTKLKLGGCACITNEACGWITGSIGQNSPRLRKLQYLDLSDCRIDDRGLRNLAERSRSLRHLSVAHCNQITTKGICCIARGCPSLETLDLRGLNRITDKGVDALSQRCQNILSLNLSLCALLTNAAAEAISRGFHGIKILTLEGIQAITEVGICTVVKSCRRLEQLDVTGCQITRSGLLALVRGIGYVKEAQAFFGFVPVQGAAEKRAQDQKLRTSVNAAKMIQKVVRKRRCRHHEAQQYHFLLEECAARLIQNSIQRSVCWKNQVLERTRQKSAVTLERIVRGWLGRLRAARRMLEIKELNRRIESIYVIQSRYRGVHVRSQDVIIQPAIEALREERRHKRWAIAATKIQCMARKHLAETTRRLLHKYWRRKSHCATAIQSFARCVQATDELRQLKIKRIKLYEAYCKAAIMIQTWRRQCLITSMLRREEFLHSAMRYMAACSIESLCRGFLARRLAQRLRMMASAAVELQRNVRGWRVPPWQLIKIGRAARCITGQADHELQLSMARSFHRFQSLEAIEKDIIDDPKDQRATSYRLEASMIGLRCKVFWPREDQYFSGLVRLFCLRKYKWRVDYDGGGYEWINFRKEHDRVLLHVLQGSWVALRMYQPTPETNS